MKIIMMKRYDDESRTTNDRVTIMVTQSKGRHIVTAQGAGDECPMMASAKDEAEAMGMLEWSRGLLELGGFEES
ncbi:MAG: hypothetical protein IJT82_03455 [Schwartzia sp.]|nr:hypothetical protein [Schwartzia sp. (in: firmicutes)]